MANEKLTDLIISKLLDAAQINFFPNGSNILEIQRALATASKRGTDKKGFPEFTAVVNDFVIVVENKAESKFQANYFDERTLLMDDKSIINYAENGALHYALKIIESSPFKKVFAFGCSGVDEKKILIRPIFVSPSGYKIMKAVKNFSDFKVENIQSYYEVEVCENKTLEQVELEDIIFRSKQLNEDLRNYGQLRDTEKPLIVSGILLALKDFDFNTENLVCDEKKSDGLKIWRAISDTLDKFEVQPDVKKYRLLDQFDFIKNRPYLSQLNGRLAKSALRYFSEYIDSNVITAIVNNSPEDVLGRFYSEFIRYSGGDGQSLGIVLTPRHIAELFCDLAQLKPSDKVFDPCCGTATFLIAAMNKMLRLAETDDEKISIKKNQLHGIELRDDMFSIATTNMILRGDGKSNLLCEDFLSIPAEKLQEKNFTVGFMNPPYSQSKKKVTSHLSELKFVSHLLDSLGENARCVVIVPQSAMVGKTSDDKDEKRYILENHTLDGVITLNPQTFYKIGTNPVIAVFTAHKPHNPEKLVKFVDFKNDGYETFPHLGFLATPDAPDRKKFLLQCWHEGKQAPTSFIIRTPIKFDDEWLHSFYYFNDEIPTDKDFEKTMADYLTFEFNMIVHGRGYLFDDEKKNPAITADLLPINSKTWKKFLIKDIFKTIKKFKQVPTGAQVNKKNLFPGKTPRITVTSNNNGIFDFYSSGDENYRLQKNFISVSFLGDCFFHSYTASLDMKVHCLKLLNFELNEYIALFLIQSLKQMTKNFNYGDQLSSTDIVNKKINLPVDEKGEPDYFFMENYMRRIEEKLLAKYKNHAYWAMGGGKNDIASLDKKVWQAFTISEIFKISSGVRLTKNNMREGKIPFIGSTDSNNGITAWVSNKNSSLDKNVLGVNYNGSVVENFYHPYEAVFSDDVKRFHLRNYDDNKYILLFIKNAILKQKIKFQYGYKFNAGRMELQKILLPVDEKGEPDWAYMESYMRRKENLLIRKYFEKKFGEVI